MSKFDELKAKKKLIVLDGPMGSELDHRGYDVNHILWSAKILMEDPDAVQQIHYDYFKAGADIGTSNSYQASEASFEWAGYTKEKCHELIALSMTLVKNARQQWWEDEGKDSGRPFPVVAGDIGPYGAYLADGSEYKGLYDLDEAGYRRFHEPRMRILKENGAEMFAIETVPLIEEAVYCAQMAEEMDMDYWVSFTFRDEDTISNGDKLDDAVKALKDFPRLKALGVNCSPPTIITPIIDRIRETCDVPVIVYPNGGRTYDAMKKEWKGIVLNTSYEDMAREWYRHGAAIIGGCCETRPKDIEAVAKVSAEVG